MTSRRSSRPVSGSLLTNRSVSRITPSLKLRPSRHRGRRAERDLDAAAADVDDDGRVLADIDAVGRRQVNQPRFLGAGDDADADADFALDLGDEVAAVVGFAHRAGRRRDDFVHAVGFGQPLELGQRLQAAAIAVGVRLRPSRPPAPSRTMSFSRSMTSKDRSGRTWHTIMWMELVPMSMAAMRMEAGAALQGRACLTRYPTVIYWQTEQNQSDPVAMLP